MSVHEVEDAVEQLVRALDESGITDPAFRDAAAMLYAFQCRFDTSETHLRVADILARRGYRADPAADAARAGSTPAATLAPAILVALRATSARKARQRLARTWFALILADAFLSGDLDALSTPDARALHDEAHALGVAVMTGPEWPGLLALPDEAVLDELTGIDARTASALRGWLRSEAQSPQ